MQTQMLIDGDWRSGADRERIAVLDPSNGDAVAEVAAGTPADAVAACDAAAKAQPGWAAAAPRVRSEILRDCHRIVMEHSDELADLITLEHGKPRADAVGEVAYAAEFFRWNAEETVRIHGTISTGPERRQAHNHPPSAGGGGGDDHAVELPGRDDHPQARPGAGRGKRGGDQAAPGGAAHRLADRRAAG